jgi:Domain of unknown function (DUF6438)
MRSGQSFLSMMGKIMRVASCIVFALMVRSSAQPLKTLDGFSITLERIGCLGSCPDYKITILGNGSVRYEGRSYVRIDDIRKRVIPLTDVQKLVQKLQEDDFFGWEEKKMVCLDFPEVHITVILKGRQKHVVEGCNSPGKILELADRIDKVSGDKRWVGKGH